MRKRDPREIEKEDRNWISPRSTKVTYNFFVLDNF
jgi:hypothetical protein